LLPRKPSKPSKIDALGPTRRCLSGALAAGKAPQDLIFVDLWNDSVGFFEQETQSLSFGSGSGGSHPLGCVKARVVVAY